MEVVLQGWKRKFSERQINYDEILTYATQQSKLEHFAKNICASSAIVNSKDTLDLKNEFLDAFEQLNVLLIKYIPGQPEAKWCTLPSLLQCWGVALSSDLLDMIAQHILFPGQKKAVELVNENLSSMTNGKFQPGHDISLKLTKDLSLHKLSKLVQELEAFLKPIVDVLDMLVFFKLYPSRLFDKYLQLNLRKGSDGEVEGLLRAANHTHDLIMKLIQGTATYFDITAEGELNLENLNIEHEFSTLHNFAANCLKCPLASCDGLAGVQSMLELFQYVHHIQTIRRVCEQYQLQGCLEDLQLVGLCQLAEELGSEENRAKLTLLEAIKKMGEVKNTLCLDSKASPSCLKLFTAVGDSADFYHFIHEKNFVGEEGQAVFQQHYQLITAQLQHEEYNETVLNHLYAAFKFIEPFMDTHQSFHQLMSKVTSLDVSSGVMQLETVNTNITLIQLWFSRAEASREEACDGFTHHSFIEAVHKHYYTTTCVQCKNDYVTITNHDIIFHLFTHSFREILLRMWPMNWAVSL